MASFRNYFIATRPWSFSMSLISVTIGTLAAAREGTVSWLWFIVVALGIVGFHAATNLLNDYFDTRNKVDQPDSPTALYRPQPLLAGLLTRRQLLTEAIILLTITVLIGFLLAWQRSLFVLWIGLAGLFASIFYTAGPFQLKYLACGELTVFLMWGPFMHEGAYAVQRQMLSWEVFFLSIPFGIWVLLVLLANNIRDIEYDARTKIKTIGILLGPARSYRLFVALIYTTFLSIIIMILAGILTPWALIVLAALPKAMGLIKSFKQKIPEGADAVTAQTSTLFGLLLILALIVNILVSS